MQKWVRGFSARKKFKTRLGQAETLAKFNLSGEKEKVFVFVQYFSKANFY